MFKSILKSGIGAIVTASSLSNQAAANRPTEGDKYWSLLKRLQQHKAKKWYEPQDFVAELIILPERSLILAIEEGGTISALKTDDSKAFTGQVEWQAAVAIPEEFLPASRKAKRVEISHAALNSETNQLYFTFVPADIGVYQVSLEDLEREARRRLLEESQTVDNRKTPSGDIPQLSRSRTDVPEKNWQKQASDDSGKSKSSLGKLRSLNNKKWDPRDLTLKCFIENSLLEDGNPRWFFGMAVASNVLYVCHRWRPNAISLWSTASDSSYGQLLYEIKQPQSDIVTNFQPFCCATLAGDKFTTLAVVDSHHHLLLFQVKTDKKTNEISAKLSQVVASKKGKENGQLKFPLGVHFSTMSGNLWVADGGNDRIQVFEKKKDPPESQVWQHCWSSASVPHTILSTVAGAVTFSIEKKQDKQPTTWIRCVAVPRDNDGKQFIIISLSEKELVCMGFG